MTSSPRPLTLIYCIVVMFSCGKVQNLPLQYIILERKNTWLKYWSEFFYINTWLKYWSKFLLLQSKKCVILGFFPLYFNSQEHIWSLVLGCWKSTKDQLLVIIIGAFSPRSRPSTEKSVKILFYHDRYGTNAIFQLFIPRSRVLSRVLPSLFNIISTKACTN